MMQSQELIYQRNLFLSFYIVLIASAFILFFFNFALILLQIFDPQEEQAQTTEEKRYVVQLQRKQELPKQIVENINENRKESEFKKFLSDEHSQSAAAKQAKDKTGEIKLNDERITSLEARKESNAESGAKKKLNFMSQSFTKESIFGKTEDKKEGKKKGYKGKTTVNRLSTSTKRAGAERLSTQFSLSTYKWNYTPYIRMIKERIRKYIAPPPAFYLGIIRGQTVFKVSIAETGELLHFKVTRHYGNKALRKTTEDVMIAIFKLPPLPPDFPDKELSLTGSILY